MPTTAIPLSKKQAQWIKTLHHKKHRQAEQCFLVEGEKNVAELLQTNWLIKFLVLTPKFAQKYAMLGQIKNILTYETTAEQLANISTLATNDTALAVVQMPETKPLTKITNNLTLVLDNIQDPGNLGTIIRIADWYGIKQIVCSEQCVECYNPKVISATKGSFLRVDIFYTSLKEWLAKQDQIIKYGALLAGQNIHKVAFQPNACLILGNEAQGISPEVQEMVDIPIAIPQFGQAESLNVAMATAIICDNWKRCTYNKP